MTACPLTDASCGESDDRWIGDHGICMALRGLGATVLGTMLVNIMIAGKL